jgi:hypothetical protein
MKNIACIALSAALLAACNSFGKDAPKASPFKAVLTAVPAAELPAKAADLVSQAKPRERKATTANVVKGALEINPAAAPAIVGAITRAVPEMAAVAAGAAAAEQPKQATAIAKAAAAAAPSQAGQIVVAVCRAVPNQYRSVAIAVFEAVPWAGKAIVNAVAAALPDMKPYIENTLAGSGGNVLSVAYTLDQAARGSQGGTGTEPLPPTLTPRATPPIVAGMARGPAIGPPFIPLSNTPTNVTSGSSGQVPGGGRDYAAP